MDAATIKKIASLAKLRIDEKNIERLTVQLSQIIAHAETINNLNLDGIEPTAHAVHLQNVFRDDGVQSSGAVSLTLAQAPEHEGNFFRVPKVL